MKQRSVAAVVILTIITFGIYGVYWAHVTCRDLQTTTKVTKIPFVVITLLVLFSSGAGGALLGYDSNETVNALKEQRGLQKTDNMILWVVFGAFLPVVTMALIQHEVNQLYPAAEQGKSEQPEASEASESAHHTESL